MTARECLNTAKKEGQDFQRAINLFLDEFRRADAIGRWMLVKDPIGSPGAMEGLVAAVVSALCREAGMATPAWTSRIYSPEPFFAFPARSYALRLRLMLESPAPFRIRNVFVPEDYLARA